jgi:hypothetical protein
MGGVVADRRIRKMVNFMPTLVEQEKHQLNLLRNLLHRYRYRIPDAFTASTPIRFFLALMPIGNF